MQSFKRTWKLSVQIKNTIKTYQELDYADMSLKIEFDVTMGVSGAFSNGNITIFGLTNDDMQYLVSCYNPQLGEFKQNYISLEVGYIDNMGLILKGNIVGIEPNFNTLGNQITLRVMSGISNNLEKNNVSTSLASDVSFKTICEECAKNNSLALNYDNTIPIRYLTDYSFNGTPYQQIMQLRRLFNDIDIFVDGLKETLNVIKKDGNTSFLNKNELSNKTGLLGKPTPTTTGLEVVSLLNTNFYAGGIIVLKNEHLKSFDSTYKIFEVKHTGGNFSDNWTSKLILRKL